MDINQLLSQLTQNAGQRTASLYSAADMLMQNAQSTQDNFAQIQAQTQQVIQEASAIAGQRAGIEYKRDVALENFNTLAGMDPEANNSVIAQRISEMTAAESQRAQLRDKITEMQSVGILDNPIQAILNSLNLPQVAAQHNALVDKRDAAFEDLQRRQQLVTAQKSALVVNTADQLRTVKLAEASQAARVAGIKAAEAEMEMQSKIAGQRLQAVQVADKAWEVNDSLFAKTLAVQQWKTSQEQVAMQRQLIQAESMRKLEDKKAQTEEIARIDANLAEASRFLGMKEPMTVAMLNRLPGSQREQWLQLGMSGMPSKLLPALEMVNKGNINAMAQSNPGAARAATELTAGIQTELNTIVKRSDAPKTREKQVEAAADAYTELLVNSASVRAYGDSLTSSKFDKLFTPYRANHVAMLQDANTGAVPALKENAFVKALTPLATNLPAGIPNVPVEQELLALKAIAKQVADGTLGLDKASTDIATYYSTAARKNFDTYQYTNFGLPAQANYMLTIPQPGYFGQPEKVDAMKPMEVKAALSKLARSSNPQIQVAPVPALRGIEATLGAPRQLIDLFKEQ